METSQCGGGWGRLKIFIHNVTFLLTTYFSGIPYKQKKMLVRDLGFELLIVIFQGGENYRRLSV